MMCDWFSCVVTKDGHIHYICREERLRLNKKGESADHHSRILKEMKSTNEFDVDKIEYNPITKRLILDMTHGKMYYSSILWRDAWFSHDEILQTLKSMPLHEMLPKGVSFNLSKYEELLKKEDKIYRVYRYEPQIMLWFGLSGLKKSLYGMFRFKRFLMGLCLHWSKESVRRKNYVHAILKQIETF